MAVLVVLSRVAAAGAPRPPINFGARYITTRSTARNGQIHVETCNVCHPFYTGKQRVLDTAGRVEKFKKKYNKE